MTPLEILKKHWGYVAFRPLQAEIIDSVLAGRDTLGLLPTGGGKSVTFQVPALLLGGLAVVVTPLVSLMKDQVDNLRTAGIGAAYLYSGMRRADATLAMDRCRVGRARLLYVSPERLQSESFTEQLRHFDVKLLVVDEAHCISQWGYDFRPSYLKIVELRALFPSAPVLALTASATPEVVDDIMERLRFGTPNVMRGSFARANISYLVRYADHKEGMVAKILRSTAGSAIVYVRSRRRTRELAEMLAAEGVSADYYHAGLDAQDKADRQDRWKSGRTRVMVATNAFGMGIDKPDVRVVVHHDLPPSLEEYYQEAGRAGRDGRPAYAVVLASRYDKGLLSRRLDEAFPPRDFIARVYELLGDFLGVCVGEGWQRVMEVDFGRFCQVYRLPVRPTHSALGLLTRSGYIEFVEETTSRSRLMVLARRDRLYGLKLSPDVDAVLEALLRSYTGLFADYVYINEATVSQRLGVATTEVYQALLTLGRMGVVSYVPRRTTPTVVYTTSREEARHLVIPREVYDVQRRRMAARLEAVSRYVFDGSQGCRVNYMLRYFGEEPQGVCGKCDVCRSVHKTALDAEGLKRVALAAASRKGGVEMAALPQITGVKAELLAPVLRQMLDDGCLSAHGSRLEAGG